MKYTYRLLIAHKHFQKILLCMLMGGAMHLCSAREEEKVPHVEQGNFALPTSQELGPLFSFGQTVIGKKDLLALGVGGYTKDKKNYAFDLVPALLYGVSDTFALLMGYPISAKQNAPSADSSGVDNPFLPAMGDLFVQGEYAFFNKDTATWANQATILAFLSLPTGSCKQQAQTGYGSPTFFFGATASHMSINWYLFGELGLLLPTRHRTGTCFGRQFWYAAGFSRNIAYSERNWLFDWLVELDGIVSMRDVWKGIVDPNSGGTSFFIAPSLFFSTQRFSLQGGIAFPAAQHLLGEQYKIHYSILINVAWKFH